jgi:hypothetical protein
MMTRGERIALICLTVAGVLIAAAMFLVRV